MTGLNHVTTGGVIGLVIANPLALPIALGSHYIVDAIPHFGNYPSWRADERKFWIFVVFDGLLTAIMFAIFWYLSSGSWLVIGSASLAAAPDITHVVDKLGKHIKPKFDLLKYDPTYKFHSGIQKSETPKGAFVELTWFGLMALAVVILV